MLSVQCVGCALSWRWCVLQRKTQFGYSRSSLCFQQKRILYRWDWSQSGETQALKPSLLACILTHWSLRKVCSFWFIMIGFVLEIRNREIWKKLITYGWSSETRGLSWVSQSKAISKKFCGQVDTSATLSRQWKSRISHWTLKWYAEGWI